MSDDLELSPAQYVVPPVQRAFLLLRYIAEGNRCLKLSRAAVETGLNRTTLIRLLHTLVEERALEKRADGYHLGLGLIGLAGDALFSKDIVEHSRPLLETLARQSELSSHLSVLDGREIVCLGRATPNVHLVSNVRVGTRMPAHATSIGRIILANMSTDAVRLIFDGAPLDPVTAKTSTSMDQLLAQIARDRALGLAWSFSNYESGLGSCAAAVFDSSGRPVAGINVTGHERHFGPEPVERQRIGDLVLACANALSARLGGNNFSAREHLRETNHV